MKAKALKSLFLFLFFTLLLGCATPYVDGGGTVYDYQKATVGARKNGSIVVINYECNSACLIKLSSGAGLRVSKDAKFGVHEPRFAPGNIPYSKGLRLERYVSAVKALILPCAVALFESRNAFSRPTLTYFSGDEVLKACPEIQEFKE